MEEETNLTTEDFVKAFDDAFNELEDVSSEEIEESDEQTVEGDTTEQNNIKSDDESGDPDETDDNSGVEAKPIVKAKGESDASFKIREKIAQKQAQIASAKTAEEIEAHQQDKRTLRRELAETKKAEKQLNISHNSELDLDTDDDTELEKLSDLLKKAGFVRAEDVSTLLAEKKVKEELSDTVEEFLASKKEFQDDELADEFLQTLNSTGIKWEQMNKKQVIGLMEHFYENSDIKSDAFEDKSKTISKAVDLQQKIKSTTFSGTSQAKQAKDVTPDDIQLDSAFKQLGL